MTSLPSKADAAGASREGAEHDEPGALDDALLDRYSPKFAGGFAWYARHLLRTRFHAVRLLRGSAESLSEADRRAGPVIVAMSHPSWWDPIVAFWMGTRWFATRRPLAPMEATQLRRFGFFRRLGVFGIDPDSPASLPATVRHVTARFETWPRTVLWITPQGRFTDPREDAPLRPGTAAIAARSDSVCVVAVAFEYAFWQDQRPEIFIAAEPVMPEGDGRGRTAGWHRALEPAMRSVRERLAAAVIARDPEAFECAVGGEVARINPVYDLWLRLRGKGGGIAARRAGDHDR